MELFEAINTLDHDRDAELKALCGIPEHIVTAAVIPRGYPWGNFGAGPRKPLDKVACIDNWGAAPTST